MPESAYSINDRIAGAVWDHLQRTLYAARLGFLRDSDQVIITSPYIRDIDNQHFIFKGPMAEILTSAESRSYSKLTDILVAIHRAGCKVGLMTAPTGSSRFGKTNADYNRDEERMLSKLRSAGVEVRLHDSNHAKHIVTPVGVITGSFNNTNRALFWQVEQATIHNPPAEQARQTSIDIWNQGYIR